MSSDYGIDFVQGGFVSNTKYFALQVHHFIHAFAHRITVNLWQAKSELIGWRAIKFWENNEAVF